MEALGLKMANLSISASWLVLAVLILRLALRKAPGWVTCALWGLVALRLVFPFSIESAWSLIPSAETIPPEILSAETPQIQSGIGAVDDFVNPHLADSLTPALGARTISYQIVVWQTRALPPTSGWRA